MSTKASVLPRWARRTLAVVGIFQLLVRGGGLLAARRLNVGEYTSARIRRVKTQGQLRISPDSQELARIELDLVLAGAELDLTAATPAPGGLDLVLTCVMAGGEVRIPAGWKVSWESRGVGGVSVKEGVTAALPATADLRVDLRAFAGGVTLRGV